MKAKRIIGNGHSRRNLGARSLILAFGVVFHVSGCRSARFEWTATSAIQDRLDQQVVAWNQGDIEGFMEAYLQSPDLTFSSGGQVTRGWRPTLDGYHKRYPTRDAMGRLTFSDLEITKLGHAAALVLGRWHLDRDRPVGGVFSLVLQRCKGRWVIIHDHTSRTPEDPSTH